MIETLAVGKLKWHHITDPTEEDFVELKEKFHFHPLDIEDCRSVNQRPKIDIYDDYYFLILQYPDFDRQDKFIFPKEVKLFWGKDYIITLERKRWHVSQLFNEYSERDDETLTKELATSDILLYRIIEKLMKESLPVPFQSPVYNQSHNTFLRPDSSNSHPVYHKFQFQNWYQLFPNSYPSHKK